MKLMQIAASAALAAASAVGLVWVMQYHRRKQRQKQTAKRSFGRDLKERDFCIDKDVCLCNNGSFSAVPRKVLNQQQRLIEQREENPELWYRRQYSPSYFPSQTGKNLYAEAVDTIADFVGAKSQDLVIVENATTAINTVLRSLPLGKGDGILITSHTYGAVQKTVQFVCEHTASEAVVIEIPLPIESEDVIVSLYSKALDEHSNIKVAVIDHISSPSAILMPVKKLAALCHARGVLVFVDGAHAPGQLPLTLHQLGVDFYCGNLHKWLFTPRGCALLWIHPNHQDIIVPVVTSWHSYAPTLMERFCFCGTRDNIPYYVAPAAIKYHEDLGGLEAIHAYNSSLIEWAADMIAEAWKTERLPIPACMRAPFMAIVAVPESAAYPASSESCDKLMSDIYNRTRVFVAFSYFNQRLWCRLSSHVYNCQEDYHRLRDAVLQVI